MGVMGAIRRLGPKDQFFDRDDGRGQLPWQIVEGSVTVERTDGKRGPNGAFPQRRVAGRVRVFRLGKWRYWPWDENDNRILYPSAKKE